ncbi:MAG TPA: YcxB family protein [Candidatus Angelobacter sp.]|nr:YcxB family protein [Candidatus Angelobacter sp.]
MKATYILTWEEFAELHTDSWPRPDYFTAIVVAGASLLMIAYGISLFAFPPLRDEKVLSFVFIGFPLFLLLVAWASVGSQSKKALKKAMAEKRAKYERWYSCEQTFFFDKEKWTHETEAGRQEAPWSALLKAVEWSNVLYLVGESSSVIVPKRVLEPEALRTLRQRAFPVPGDQWPFQITAWDYQATEMARLWRKHWLRFIFANVFGLGVLVWVFQIWLTSQEKVGAIIGWILAASAIILVLTAQLWYLPLRYATSAKNWRAPKKIGLSASGLHISNSPDNRFTAWKVFPSFQEVPRAFLVYVDPTHYYLLPKRCFSTEQRIQIRFLLHANVKAE